MIRTGAALCAITLAALACADVPPNIVWIVADDMSPDMGCYGDRYAWTPNLDRLAEQGCLYSRAFSVNGQCAPSRSALATGMYPTTIGTHNMRCLAVPPPYVQLVSVYLRRAGYYCINNGKADYNLGVGEDVRSGIFVSPLGAWDEEGVSASWRHRAAGQPFFAVYNLAQTHESRLHLAPRPFENIVKEVPPEHRHDPRSATLPAYYPENDVFRADWARYYDAVSALDIAAGRILDELDAEGVAENTVVIFFGDHGRPLPRAKRWLYDSGLWVPLLVRWPGAIAPRSSNDELISFVDFAPTTLVVAGIDVPAHMQGHAFLANPGHRPSEYVFAARDRVDELTDRVRSVRGPRYHYIRNDFPDIPYAFPLEYMDRMPCMKEWRRLNAAGELSGPAAAFFAPVRPPEELYDTAADPDEVRSLAEDSDQLKRLATFRAALDKWIRDTHDLGQRPESELNDSWRPNGVWTQTQAPVAVPPSGTVPRGTRIELTCSTEGALIEYADDNGPRASWTLYSKPISVSADCRLRVRAGRLGFRNSDEISLEYFVK